MRSEGKRRRKTVGRRRQKAGWKVTVSSVCENRVALGCVLLCVAACLAAMCALSCDMIFMPVAFLQA